MNLPENGNRVSGHRDNGRLVHDILVESVDGVCFRCLRCGNVETHLHETDGSLVVLVELQSNLILTGSALGHHVQGNVETGLVLDVEAQQGAVELGRAIVPAAQRQLLLEHLLFVVVFEVRRDLLLIRVLEPAEPVQGAVLHEYPNAVRVQHALEVHKVHVGRVYRVHLARLAVLEDDVLVGHLQPAFGLQINRFVVSIRGSTHLPLVVAPTWVPRTSADISEYSRKSIVQPQNEIPAGQQRNLTFYAGYP